MNYDRKYTSDPEIHWSRFMCPFCNEPTGPESNCHNMSKDNQPRLMTSPGSGMITLFSNNCSFRQDRIWDFKLNYPFSNLLMEKFSGVQGIEKIVPISKYSGRISVGQLFPDGEVKKEITLIYKNFIKQLQTIENQICSQKNREKEEVIGISFPNGKEFFVNFNKDVEKIQAQQEVCKRLSSQIKNSHIMLKKVSD